MCSYDNMIVAPTTEITLLVARTNNSKISHNSFNKFRRNFKNIFEKVSLLLFIYLLISPVSGGPFILPEKTASITPIASPIRHSHRGHPRVGIGEAFLSSQEDFTNLPAEFQGLPFPSSIYSTPSAHNSHKLLKASSRLRSPDGNARHQHQVLLQDTLSGLRVSPSDLSATQVPKPSGATLRKVFDPSQSFSVLSGWRSHQTRSHLRRSLKVSSMDEGDSSHVAGRERRATTSTPSGNSRREWEKPCPNLDHAVDANATPKTLSTLILKAIHGAKSQVDQFINDFARETFHVESWEASLPEHQGFSLPFLNNSSGVDLSTPKNVPFPRALQEAYELMQRRAVGIEQVTLDQALYQAKFLSEFRDVEHRIVHVLCELRHAMIQSDVKPKQDVTKDVMEEGSRDMDGERERNIRDAVILREYVRGLEILHALFYHYEMSSLQ